MKVKSLSTAFTTNKVKESCDFYVNYFRAKITFDCGWYVNLEFGSESTSIQFMSPQQPGQELSESAGLMYNFLVDDVDAEYKRLTDAGLCVVVPLEDHPWGDKGFAIQDPNGISLYIYSEREPNEEFKQYFKVN
jgi:uncharacterized glyoxalase superfamily protein PhnB